MAEPRADIDAAVEFFVAARDFEWTWGVADVERFSRVMGWRASELRTETTIVMNTSARLDKPLARFELDGGKIHQVTAHVTDPGEVSTGTLDTTVARVNDLLGAPFGVAVEPKTKLFWDSSDFVAEVVRLDRFVIASLVRRDYPPLVDELEARGFWSPA